MITLIGTGHVFNLSSALLNIFEEKKPDIICVELDKQRFNAMIAKKTNPEQYKSTNKNVPIVYKMMARFQDNMADEYGVTAGEEMYTAFQYAQSHQLPIKFIDMNAQQLFKKMLKSMSISEKFKLFLTGVGGFFVSKKRVEKELDKFEKNFDDYIEEIGKKFPTIKRVLIDDRNKYMSEQISSISEEYNQIITLVGDGHVPGMKKLLEEKGLDFSVVRLKELRQIGEVETESSTCLLYTSDAADD